RQIPTRTTKTRHRLRDRTPPNRARLRARPCAMGRRAHLRLAAPLQATTRPLRPPPRDPRSLPRHRLLPRLLQEAAELIVIRVLRVSRRYLLMLLGLSAIWGASFMFIKIAVRELEPTTLVCVRLGIGALTLLPLVLLRLGGRETVRQLRAAAGPLVAIGLVNSAIPIVSISWA